MTLAIGDHLVIKREGKIVGPEEEAYHEYEVVAGLVEGNEVDYVPYSSDPDSPHDPKSQCSVKLRVVK